MRLVLAGLAACLFTLLPSTGSAVTLQEIVALSKAGLSSQVILALIERDGTVFRLTPEQVAELKKDGVSEDVLLAMLKSGSPERPTQGPTVVVVGNGPDRPNAADLGPYGAFAPPVAPYPAPYFVAVPYFYFVPVPSRLHQVVPAALARQTMPPTIGIGAPPTPIDATGIFFRTASRGQFFGQRGPDFATCCAGTLRTTGTGQ